MFKSIVVLAALLMLEVILVQPSAARDRIRIVGSSTVYPFTTVVAEAFGRTSNFPTPVIESTGTGGGFALFCAGVGERFPDFNNASRSIKKSEIDLCFSNGITDIIEIKIGYDGIVVANSRKSIQMDVTRSQLWLALAREVPDSEGSLVPNYYQKWSEIHPSLPNQKIEVLGPPPTSGTRDAFVELVMNEGCATFQVVASLKKTNEGRFDAVCQSFREDGAFVEAGENDVLIIRKLEANPDAFGIFGFSFLEQNSDVVRGSSIEGVSSAFENIADGAYSISRPLYVYAKKAHAKLVPGMEEFIYEFTSEGTWGDDGYLIDRGLIPMLDEERKRYSLEARSLIVNLM